MNKFVQPAVIACLFLVILHCKGGAEQRDVRQLLIHRHKLVEMRTRVKNALQHLAMNRGMQKKRTLWSEAGQKAFRELALPDWAGCRRADLLETLAYLDKKIAPLDRAAEELSQLDEVAASFKDAAGGRSDYCPGVCRDYR